MYIAVVKSTGYSIEYVKKISWFDFIDLFQTVENISEQKQKHK